MPQEQAGTVLDPAHDEHVAFFGLARCNGMLTRANNALRIGDGITMGIVFRVIQKCIQVVD